MKRLEPIGKYIHLADTRNTDLSVTNLVGLTIEKMFIPSVANTIDTDLSKYKIIKEGQFACSLMQVSRDGKMPVAMYKGEPAIMSPAYPIFEVNDANELMPEYLHMYLSRPEFDREAVFRAVGGVRGSLDWDDFMAIRMPVPLIDEQRRIVAEWQTIEKRIDNNNQLIAALTQTAQNIYHHTFVENIDPKNLPQGWRMGTLKEICLKIGSGATPKGGKEGYLETGVSLIRSLNVFDFNFHFDDLAHISESQAKLLDGVTVKENDVLFNITGASVARCCIVPKIALPARVNQHVMIIRPKIGLHYYILCTLCSEHSKRTLLGMSQSGSTREAITKSEIESFKIVIPPDKLIQEYNKSAQVIFSQIDILKQENLKLAKVKYLLLSKLS